MPLTERAQTGKFELPLLDCGGHFPIDCGCGTVTAAVSCGQTRALWESLVTALGEGIGGGTCFRPGLESPGDWAGYPVSFFTPKSESLWLHVMENLPSAFC